MCHKAAETAPNINNVFGPVTGNKHIVQWCFKKFCEEDENLEDEEHSDQPLEVYKDQLRASSKLTTMQGVAK